MAACDAVTFGLCLTRPPVETGFAIFGFAEFLAALALLVLVFTSSDFLYQFRASVAAIPLRWLSFIATVLIGTGTLLTDLWFAERWYSLPWGMSRAVLQSIFGALFLLTALLWIWFAFVRPPIFSRWNGRRFYSALFRTIVRGSDSQLATVAGELVRSAEPLITYSQPRRRCEQAASSPATSDWAHDALMMLGNRKLCRHVVASSPVTAIVLMEEASRQKKYNVPLGGFARNVTTEALLNRDSILYHEDTYGWDVLGWVQPFSNALYGDYRLVEGLSNSSRSPLDVDWGVAWQMDGDQFEAYCRITLITFKSYIETGLYHSHSYALFRAFGVIKEAARELYKLDNQPADATDSTAGRRLAAAVGFVDDVIKFLGEQENLKFGQLRSSRLDRFGHGPKIFDDIADIMYSLLLAASAVRSPPDNAWWIHYNTLWSRFFTFRTKSKAWNVIRFKFSRLVFDEIKRLEDLPNYEGARILGICLNVLGLSLPLQNQRDDEDNALRKAVLNWTKRNYLKLSKVHPPVAESCLMGSISFEPAQRRLVKTYAQGLELKPSREYLKLDQSPASV